MSKEEYAKQVEIAIFELVKLPDSDTKAFMIEALRESIDLKYPVVTEPAVQEVTSPAVEVPELPMPDYLSNLNPKYMGMAVKFVELDIEDSLLSKVTDVAKMVATNGSKTSFENIEQLKNSWN